MAAASWTAGCWRSTTGRSRAEALLFLAGIALWSQGGWWRPTAVLGLSVSTVLLLLYITPWYLFILPVNVALIVGIAGMDRPSTATAGA